MSLSQYFYPNKFLVKVFTVEHLVYPNFPIVSFTRLLHQYQYSLYYPNRRQIILKLNLNLLFLLNWFLSILCLRFVIHIQLMIILLSRRHYNLF